jgi:ABC-type transport system involved in multi-copper enzyme maturation permease subunit
MISLPDGITLTSMLADYMQYVALFIPVLAAFFGYGLVKRILRRG